MTTLAVSDSMSMSDAVAVLLSEPAGVVSSVDQMFMGDSVNTQLSKFTLLETQEDLQTWSDSAARFNIGQSRTTSTLIIAEFKLSGGTLFRSTKGIRHPTKFYTGRVKSFGSVIRSIAIPAALPQVSDAQIQIIDTDRELSKLFAATPPHNAEVVLKIGSEGESEDLFQTIYTGLIDHAVWAAGVMTINLKDLMFQFMMDQLPNLLTRDNFIADPLFAKNLKARTVGAFKEREIFAPIVFGILDSTGNDTSGVLNAVRLDSTTFNLAQHPIPHDPIRLFKKEGDDTEFTEITGGFSIIEVAKTIEEVDYVFTHAVFGSARADDYELRWDGEGMTDTGDKDGTVVRDPAECIRLYLTRIAQRDESVDIDTLGFTTAGTAMAAVETGSPTPGLFCDGAITQRLFHQEAIARLVSSFGLFMFADKRGRVTIRYVDSSDLNRPLLDDVQDIYLKSEKHALGKPIVNEVLAQFSRIFSDQDWNDELVITDIDAVEILGDTKERDLKLFFVRDVFVADKVARNSLQWTHYESYRVQMVIPGHRRTADIELASLIGVTNYSGIDESNVGYLNKEFLVYKTEFQTDSKQLRVSCIARVGPPGRTISQSSEWITITSGAGVGLKGDYEELIASIDDLGTWVLVQFLAGAGFAQSIFIEFDLAIGPIGNEIIFVPDMLYVQTTPGVGGNVQQDFSFPFRIPAGSRISARSKDDKSDARDSEIIVHVHG